MQATEAAIRQVVQEVLSQLGKGKSNGMPLRVGEVAGVPKPGSVSRISTR